MQNTGRIPNSTLMKSGNKIIENNSLNKMDNTSYSNQNGSGSTLKGKLERLEESISNSSTELITHKNEAARLDSEKESIESMTISKQEEVKNSVLQDLNKINEELQRHSGHQKSENKRLKQQVDHIKSKNQILQKDLEDLEKRLVGLELQVGIDDFN